MTGVIRISLMVGASILALGGEAQAQTGTRNQSSDRATADVDGSSAGLDAIVVTANRRTETLSRVGTTAQVLGAEQLAQQHVRSLADIANVVPGLSFANSQNSTPVYTLRGVGFYESSAGSYATVSLYQDEAPLPFPVMTRHSDYDLQRVEVLKGPQGTLYGQNSTGGAINFIAARPSSTFHAGADVTYGSYDLAIVNGYLTGPVADNLNFRLSGRYFRQDGWQRSNTRPGDRNGKQEAAMLRLLLDWDPTETLSIRFNANGWIDDGDNQAGQVISFNFQNPIQGPLLLAQPLSPLNAKAADWVPGLTDARFRMLQTSVRVDWEFVDGITLTSLSSYAGYEARQGQSYSGLPIFLNEFLIDDIDINTFYQEVRLANAAEGATRWIVGANYSDNKTVEDTDSAFFDSSAATTLSTFLGYADFGRAGEVSRQHFRSYAAFANIEHDILPSITLRGGLRYTSAKDKGDTTAFDPIGSPQGLGAFVFDILLGGAFGTYTAGRCFAINNSAVEFAGIAPGAPGCFSDKLNEDNLSWKVGADFRVSPTTLFYANVAKGYKAGSFPFIAATTAQQFAAVRQESVLSYEVGFKASLFDRRVQLDGALFYYDYKDKQVRSKIIDPVFQILDVLQNIPKSKIKGLELSATARPVVGLTIAALATYIDSEVTEFVGINGNGVAADFSGTELPFTPKWNLTGRVNYEAPVASSLDAFAGVDVTYRSQSYSIIGGRLNPPNANPNDYCLFCIPAYALVGFSAGVKSSDDRWSVSVWGKNIFNKYYWNNVFANSDTILRYTGMPRTFGLTVGTEF